MNYEIKFKKLSKLILGTLKDRDTGIQTIIEAQSLTDLMELIRQSIEIHERMKDEKCKAIPKTYFAGSWGWIERD